MKISQANILKVQINPTLPHDPSEIVSMADYDTMLVLYRVWFNYDDDRTVLPGIVHKWTFNQDGYYEFEIDKRARWSDGSPITSKQLIFNLERLRKKKSNYIKGILSIIDIEKTKIISDQKFNLYIKDKKPSTDFFERMAAAFLAIVHPQDVDENGKIKSNTLASGPYKISKFEKGYLELVRNEYDFQRSLKRAEKIILNTNETRPTNVDFINEKSWANIVLTSTLIQKDLGELLLKKKLPYWTRSHDRVSNLISVAKEGHEKSKFRLELQRHFQKCWAEKESESFNFKVKKAYSLQPEGYPLFHEKIDNSIDKNFDIPKNAKISIATTPHEGNYFQIPYIEKCFDSLGVKVEWKYYPSHIELNAAAENPDNFDYKIVNYGVADPQPVAWMGLNFSKDLRFLKYTEEDYNRFKLIAKSSGEKQIIDFKKLLIEMMSKGQYSPLFHYSTLVIGKKGLSFKNIRELDETVDYSKVEFE